MFQTSIASWLQPACSTPDSNARLPKDSNEDSTPAPQRQNDASSNNSESPARPCKTSLPFQSASLNGAVKQRLPPNVSITPCTEQHLQSFRRLNALLLPIPYPDKFYTESINDPIVASVTKIALWDDAIPSTSQYRTISPSTESSARLVASIRCRILKSPPQDTAGDSPSLYISTLATLAPFRRHGLASHLLSQVSTTAVREYGVKTITAHVWEANEDALEWYKHKGFRIVGKEDDYYRRLAPKTSAWVMLKDARVAETIAVDSFTAVG